MTERKLPVGSWSMHIEGHGIHDNGRPDDAEVLFHAFVRELTRSQDVAAASITIGGTRELAPISGCVNCAEAGEPDHHAVTKLPADTELAWRHR